MNRNQRRAMAKSKNPHSVAQAAASHKQGGRPDKAEQIYRKAIARDPTCYEAHNNLGNLLHETGRIVEATRHFALAYQLNPKDPAVAFNLAVGLSAQNHYRHALPSTGSDLAKSILCRRAVRSGLHAHAACGI